MHGRNEETQSVLLLGIMPGDTIMHGIGVDLKQGL